MIRADQDRNFTFREAFDLAGDTFVKLSDETLHDLDVSPDGRWAVGRDPRGYCLGLQVKPPPTVYRVNTTTGERTLMFKNLLVGANTFGISTDGHYFLFWKDSRYQAYDLDAATTKALGGPTPPALANNGMATILASSPRRRTGRVAMDVLPDRRLQKHDLWVPPLDGRSRAKPDERRRCRAKSDSATCGLSRRMPPAIR